MPGLSSRVRRFVRALASRIGWLGRPWGRERGGDPRHRLAARVSVVPSGTCAAWDIARWPAT